ncbi:WD40/YVTN/BNR-like repeat-containing protein [Daejeonella sp.]|uniref:WD40/YVTN/BNR-like repeat-containing protein n=1 Tax=Daejeonella sp. TaxID=2805397 RepID=UPI003982D818
MVEGSVKNCLLTFALWLIGICALYCQDVRTLQTGTKTSIRGLSVVDNLIAWVSGSNGWTSVTTDGGLSWKWNQIPGYEKFDFRDIEAFSSSDAIIVSAGSPAVILLTQNGGSTWKEVYKNESPDIFLDGMDFQNRQNGVIYGDPIKNKMQLLRTYNGGISWKNISNNLKVNLIDGEASFAASGTGIRILKNGRTFIATGGNQSRIFVSRKLGNSWNEYPCPIIQGRSSAGPFSIAFINNKKGMAVGGDYLLDTLSSNNMLLTRNGGKSWQKPLTAPFGYKSAVEYITKKLVIATGTSGTDISKDGGMTWENLTKEGFNAVRRAKGASLVLLAGSNGKISIFQYPE